MTKIFPYRLLGFSLMLGAIMTILYATVINPPVNKRQANGGDTSWIPKGFEQYDNNFAIKWGTIGITGDFWTYANIQVISRKSCGNLYVEMTELSKENTNIGYTNATTAGLRSGETADLNLRSSKPVHAYRISKISCY
jgi:hypothetical protein